MEILRVYSALSAIKRLKNNNYNFNASNDDSKTVTELMNSYFFL